MSCQVGAQFGRWMAVKSKSSPDEQPKPSLGGLLCWLLGGRSTWLLDEQLVLVAAGLLVLEQRSVAE